MNSSTSSSERVTRPIPLKDGRAALAALGITLVAAFVAGELFLRIGPIHPLAYKTPSDWYQDLRRVRDVPGDQKVLFYGSSRVHLGISPEDFDDQMKRTGRRTRSWNLALRVKRSNLGLVAHEEEGLRADVVVIEELDQQLSSDFELVEQKKFYENLRREAWKYPLDRGLEKFLWKHALIFRNQPYRTFLLPGFMFRLETHPNGWSEVTYGNPRRLEKRRLQRMRRPLRTIPEKEKREARQTYQGFFDRLRKSGARLVILRMPTDAPVPSELPGWGPDILYIDSTRHPLLQHFRTAEGSHLDGKTAREFSRAVAGIMDDWLKRDQR